jgi:hypothetical protein
MPSISPDDPARIIHMRRAFDDTCQRLTDEGYDADEILITMVTFSVADMNRHLGLEFALHVLTDTLACIQAEHEAKESRH